MRTKFPISPAASVAKTFCEVSPTNTAVTNTFVKIAALVIKYFVGAVGARANFARNCSKFRPPRSRRCVIDAGVIKMQELETLLEIFKKSL